MIQFSGITLNHLPAPLALGRDVQLQWCYGQTPLRDLVQTAFRAELFDGEGLAFSSGWVESADMTYSLGDKFALAELHDYELILSARFSDGREIVSAPQNLLTGLFGRESFLAAGCHWMAYRTAEKNAPAVPAYTRSFRLSGSKRILSARAYLFAAGFSLFTVNGREPDDRMLAPANSVYEKRCYYETYDIAPLLHTGENRLSLLCGSGYDRQYSQWGFRYFGKKGFMGLIRIVFADGSVVLIPSDGRWRCHETGYEACSMYGGEHFDAGKTQFARLPLGSLDAKAPYAPEGLLLPRPMPPVKIIEKTEPVALWPLGEDLVVDFGRNTAGVVEITLKAQAGRQVRLRHAESLFTDGSPDFFTNRDAKAEDIYICGGDGAEHYLPRFTYHCFRYVLISGLKEQEILSLKKAVLGCALEETGSFSCSDAAVNRIHELMKTGMRNNLFTIPTDCAVRDERTPCDMDSQAIERSVLANFDAAAYYSKWLEDVVDRHKPGAGNPDWKGDMVSLMSRIYDASGDLRPAARHYETALDFFFDMMGRRENGLYTKNYGDWCHPNAGTWETYFGSVTAVNTALLFGMGRKLIRLGRALGKNAALLKKLEDACEELCRAFEEQCVHGDGTVMSGEQTEMFMPLYEGLVRGETAQRVEKALLARLEKDDTLQIGIYGAMSCLEVLRRAGKEELALKLLKNPAYPGYSNLIAMGATSLWEQWYYKGGMNSHSHGMFAGPDASFYEMFAGLRATAAGFAEAEINPRLPGSMTMVRAEQNTVRGKIAVSLERLADGYEMRITIPVGVKAKVQLPAPEAGNVLFDGERPMQYARTLALGSGQYIFRSVPAVYQPREREEGAVSCGSNMV